ncbi:MAG TPA: F0F1 ATP synthase subunit A [Rhodothermales bacterium]|nr:F0F1 ATP synthase subunit A [Rhodothermales bacterium]
MRTRLAGLSGIALVLAALSLAAPARAQEHEEGRLDAVHHTADGYYLDFAPIGQVQLPRLFVVRRADGALGFDAFASTSAAVASGRYHAVTEEGHGGGHAEEGHAEEGAHEEPAPAEGTAAEHSDHDAAAPLHAGENVGIEIARGGEEVELALVEAGNEGALMEAHLTPADGGEVVADLSITRHVAFLFFVCFLLFLLLIPMGGRYKRGVGRTSAPKGLLQNMLETLVLYIRDEVAKPNLGDKTNKYLPYLLTAFFFILISNLIGLVPWGATVTSNIAVTVVLAVCTFVVTQFAGSKDYWKHIFWPPGVPLLVKPILIPIEILGLFTKPFALAIRLFANMTAGHLVILNFVGLIFIIKELFGSAAGWGTGVPALAMAVFIYGLELLVAFIQAYVFTMLSALFIGMATAEHEHDHDHSQDHGLTAHDLALAESSPVVHGGRPRPDHERTVGTEAALSPF